MAKVRDLKTLKESKKPKQETSELEFQVQLLQDELNTEEKSTEQLRTNQKRHLEKLIKIDKEYQRVIKEYQNKLSGQVRSAQKNLLESTSQNLSTIDSLHSELIQKLQTVQYKTGQIMLDQQQEMLTDFSSHFETKQQEIGLTKKENLKKLGNAQKREEELTFKKEQAINQFKLAQNTYIELENKNQNIQRELEFIVKDKQNFDFQLEYLRNVNLRLKSKLSGWSSTPSLLQTYQNEYPTQLQDTPKNPQSDQISTFKKQIKEEKLNLRYARNLLNQELSKRNQLTKLLKDSIEDIRSEIFNLIKFHSPQKKTQSQVDKTKYLELLLSKEKAISLLYDRAFPHGVVDSNYKFGKELIPKSLSFKTFRVP